MKNKQNNSRRTFIKQASAAAISFTIVPRYVLGGKGYKAPSDKLNIAYIGIGGRAEDHIRSTKGTENLVAFCDVDTKRAENTLKEFPKVPLYKDFRKLFEVEHKNIDAVMIATPDHTHTPAALLAMDLGKHVYVEKPLTHNIGEARQLLVAAQKSKVVTQMGNQGASMDCNAIIAEYIQSGVIGKVEKVHVWTNRPVWPQGVPTPVQKETVPNTLDWNLWLGPAPYREYNKAYLPFKWRGWWDFGTGSLGDMGCHIFQVPYRALNLKYPTAIEASATTVWSGDFVEANYPDSCPPSSMVKFTFPGVDLFWYDGGIKPMRPEELGENEPFGSWDGGALFEGEKGKLLCDMYGENPILLFKDKQKKVSKPEPFLPRYTGSHQMVWVNACKGLGKASSPFEDAVPLTETLLIANLAIRCYDVKKLQAGKTPDSWAPYDYPGRIRLLWDAEKMTVPNYPEANEFISRGSRTY
jgi:hypothetical protein